MPLRKYQQQAAMLIVDRDTLNLRFPPGYGKTRTIALCYQTLCSHDRVNRLLIIVPRTAQHKQFLDEFGRELDLFGLPGPYLVTDIGDSGTRALKRHRENTSQIFVVTIQALVAGQTAWDTLAHLMATGKWMMAIDEYHHYGQGRRWAEKANQLSVVVRLALSATPDRPNDDGAFGAPDLQCTYREAFGEGAVKHLRGASYTYSVEIETKDGTVKSYTTHELLNLIGTDDPDAIEAEMIAREMRWSPKYIAPLVDRPVHRLLRSRATHGLPAQMLVKAMSCSHAKLVCEQISAMYPELRVDWVGTGPHGRTDEENERILERFCPKKRDGWKQPTDIQLDIIVQVGIVGEGLDTVYVTEVVFLTVARGTNQDHQTAGRAARIFPSECGVSSDLQVGYINFDSTSGYARYVGDQIMDALDNAPPGDAGTETEENWDDPDPLTPDPIIRIIDVSCVEVDEGEVERMSHAILRVKAQDGMSSSDLESLRRALADPLDPIHEAAEAMYRRMRQREAEQFNDVSRRQQWSALVELAVTKVAKNAVFRLWRDHEPKERGRRVGRVKHRINLQKFKLFGQKHDLEVAQLKASYQWLVQLQTQIRNEEIPTWLRRAIDH